MKKILSVVSLFVVFSSFAVAESEVLDLKSIEGEHFSVNLTTRILGEQNETIWHMDSSNITVSGEAVKVKLSGDNLVLIANITPYLNKDNTIFLVAKGEIFLSDSADSEDVKYYTTLKSLPITNGEKVIFFPLGMAYDSNSNFYSMEMEIQVLSVNNDANPAKVE